MSNPLGRSNSSAGPPSGSLQARSVTAAISRSGLTGSEMRDRSLRLSRSARKSLRSAYISVAGRLQHAGTTKARTLTKNHEKEQLGLFRVFFRGFESSWLHFVVYLIRDLLRQFEGASACFAGDDRCTARAHRIDEVGELTLERLLVDNFDLAALDRRHRAV